MGFTARSSCGESARIESADPAEMRVGVFFGESLSSSYKNI
jgi:hypothetical protein